MRVCCAKVQRQQASHPSEAGCMVELTVFSGQVCARRHLAGAFLLWLRTQELSASGEGGKNCTSFSSVAVRPADLQMTICGLGMCKQEVCQ